MNKEKLSKKNWFIITLFCFMGGIAWNTENMYFNTFITNEIYADVTQSAIRGNNSCKEYVPLGGFCMYPCIDSLLRLSVYPKNAVELWLCG